MEYQLRSRGIVPTLNSRNPYRNVGLALKRRRRIPRGQKGGLLFTPALYAAAKSLARRARRSRKGKQRGGNIFLGAAKMGYKLGKQKDYKRMGLTGAAQSTYRRVSKEPWYYQ